MGCLCNFVPLYRVSQYSETTSPNRMVASDFWQTGSLFVFILIVGEKFDIDREPPARFP